MRNTITYISLSGIILLQFVPTKHLLAQAYLGQFNEKNLQEILYSEQKIGTTEKKVTFPLKELVKEETSLVFSASAKNTPTEIENTEFCPTQSKNLAPCSLLKTLPEKTTVKKKTRLFIDQDKLTFFLEKIASEFEKPALEPILYFDESSNQLSLKRAGAEGFFLNKEETLNQIISSLKNNPKKNDFSLITTTVKPKILTNNLDSLGIKEKIATGQSNFAGSTQNRIHNIKISSEKFNGAVIPPQSEFSFIEILGPVDKTTGYKEELVIKNNETIPEFGGGVCQTSTTLFRSVLNAGFEITERKNHAYPVQYYAPQGTDATVYIPHPDLRFINNTNHYALLQTKIEGNLLIFDIYGTNDGRQVKINGPIVVEKNVETKTMRTTLTQTVTNSNGEIIVNKTFNSFYDNPQKYKKEQPLNKKPEEWSKKEWEKYKKEHN